MRLKSTQSNIRALCLLLVRHRQTHYLRSSGCKWGNCNPAAWFGERWASSPRGLTERKRPTLSPITEQMPKLQASWPDARACPQRESPIFDFNVSEVEWECRRPPVRLNS